MYITDMKRLKRKSYLNEILFQSMTSLYVLFHFEKLYIPKYFTVKLHQIPHKIYYSFSLDRERECTINHEQVFTVEFLQLKV